MKTIRMASHLVTGGHGFAVKLCDACNVIALAKVPDADSIPMFGEDTRRWACDSCGPGRLAVVIPFPKRGKL
jgi:hypothetical protein